MVENPLLTSHYQEILVIVRDNPGIKKSELYELLDGSRNTRQDRTDELIKLKLIEEQQLGRYNIKTLHITEKGLATLDTIERLNKLISDEPTTDYVQDHKESIQNTLSEQQKD